MDTSRAFARRSLTGAAVLVVVLLACSCGPRPEPQAATTTDTAPFTIIALPDTQIYAESFPDIFYNQTEWIKANAEKLNIVCVLHEGDITNRNSAKEWEVADKALSTLDGVVPYCLVPGNHDTGPGGGRGTRDTEFLDEHFPPSRFEGKPWYGGSFEEGTIKNAYYTFEAAGMTFLVVCLEFGPRDEALEWASEVVAEHKDRKVIVVTHCYMFSDDTRVGPSDGGSPHGYPNGGNDGEEIWTKLVGKHENIVLVLSGHICGDGAGRLTSEGEHGNPIHELLANYQMMEKGGNGWLRIMTFVPDEDKIVVSTYSPLLDKYLEDDENKFELELEMK